MRRLARLSLAALGLALVAPISVNAQEPQSRSATATSAHRHARGAKYCAKCGHLAAPKVTTVDTRPAVAGAVVPSSMPGGEIVSCSHLSKGVCKECSALLSMPGQVTVVGNNTAAPGRAVASDSAPGLAVVEAGEPEPIGVMRTNYSASAAAPAGLPAPGRATVNGGARPTAAPSAAVSPSAGRDPFLPASPAPRPQILGHLFGLSEMSNNFHDGWMARGKKRKEAHAAIPYGASNAAVEELPASMVYGRNAH